MLFDMLRFAVVFGLDILCIVLPICRALHLAKNLSDLGMGAGSRQRESRRKQYSRLEHSRLGSCA